MKILRFWGAILAVVASGLLVCLWFLIDGDRFGLTNDAQRLRACLVVAAVCVLSLVAKEAFMPMWRRRQNKEQERLRPPSGTQTQVASNADAELSSLCEELRTVHGVRWRYRLRWLLVSGTDDRIDQVAPGLRQAGVLRVGETVLLHAAPDGVEAAKWLGKIRKLRGRRPVDGVVHVARADDANSDLPRMLSGIATALGWAAPITFLHPVEANGSAAEDWDTVAAFLRNDARAGSKAIGRLSELLDELEYRTADTGMGLFSADPRVTWLIEISKYVGDYRDRIAKGVQALVASGWLRAPLAGVIFAPVFSARPDAQMPVADRHDSLDAPFDTLSRRATRLAQPAALPPVWHEIATRSPSYRGRRVRLHWPDALATSIVAGSVLWSIALIVSGLGNRAVVRDAEAAVATALAAAPATPEALRAQLALQRQIDTLEYRVRHGVPWHLRAGLSRNDELLDRLWQPYKTVAVRNLRQPIAHALEAQLTELSKVRADEQQSQDARQRAYNRLKVYLMLATPARTDGPFLSAQLLDVWPAVAGMRTGEWLDISQQLARFWSEHLRTHPDWRIDASTPIVTRMRSMLVNQIGLAASDDVLYRRILDEARGKYADVSLSTLLAGTDAHGLFAATRTVPGIFTRPAWDGVVDEAIEAAAKERHVEADWVLVGDKPAAQAIAAATKAPLDSARAALDPKLRADTLRQRLRERYFADYTAAWTGMLNSLQWVSAASLSGVIDQLTRMTDAQTSPLLAVMKSVQYHGQAGRPSQALADTLVRKAQGLLAGSDGGQTLSPTTSPLDRSFGPLLALLGDADAAAASGKANMAQSAGTAAFSGVSLSRVLTADTTVRLKLQQIQASPDAQAMALSLAQAVFQGKLSDLSQARDDAALTAASLGAQWAGFGQTMFVQPLDAAWQAVLQPAAASLNEAWRAGMTATFASTFSERYPVSPTSADASFAEFGRFVRPDAGLIDRFIQTELSGVLKRQGDRWVPSELAPQSLQFDPAFLDMLRLIGPLGARLYAPGEARYRFDVMPQPTPGVTHTTLTVDRQAVEYFNQRDDWSALAWPGNGLAGHALLTWQTQSAGLRIAFDATGDWAFLRLLEKAQVKRLDESRYELVWNAEAGGDAAQGINAVTTRAPSGTAAPLRYVLRTQAGPGPLELLELRGFRMPQRIFLTGRAGATAELPSLPPLPPEMEP